MLTSYFFIKKQCRYETPPNHDNNHHLRKKNQTTIQINRNHKTVFPPKAKGGRQIAFRLRLITLATRYNNPRFRKIHYHTLRHCKALREYHKTHSMQHVKRILGHKSIETTQRYVDLYEELYTTRPKKTICEIALNSQESKKLIEQGFRYETGEYNDGGKLFYKEKFV